MHPEAGGAELFTHEIAKRLARKGHLVTLYCPNFPNGKSSEEIDGVIIKREGGKYSVYRKAKKFFKKFGSSFDLVVDEINAKPFLNPNADSQIPIVGLIHQTIREEWFYEMPFPLSYIFYHIIEKFWLKPYFDILTVTVSRSSKRELESLGFSKVVIVPVGLSIDPLESVREKEPDPTICFVGRLKKHKLPDHALEAFLLIKKKIPNAKMWYIGDGDMRRLLEIKASNCSDITFYGRVNDAVKFKLLSRAHLLLMPSIKEGWGLVVTEAYAMGTPVIGYNVPGLRDSILEGKTGYLVRTNSSEDMAKLAINLLNDRDLLNQYSNNALCQARKFSWDISANMFDDILLRLLVT
jgi:glycosyltransferase involved in cell wall biosynthesis